MGGVAGSDTRRARPATTGFCSSAKYNSSSSDAQALHMRELRILSVTLHSCTVESHRIHPPRDPAQRRDSGTSHGRRAKPSTAVCTGKAGAATALGSSGECFGSGSSFGLTALVPCDTDDDKCDAMGRCARDGIGRTRPRVQVWVGMFADARFRDLPRRWKNFSEVTGNARLSSALLA